MNFESENIAKERVVMSEKQKYQVVYVLAQCFYFFAKKIIPDSANAPQHYIQLARECEKALTQFDATIKSEPILKNPIVKYKGQEIPASPLTRLD